MGGLQKKSVQDPCCQHTVHLYQAPEAEIVASWLRLAMRQTSKQSVYTNQIHLRLK